MRTCKGHMLKHALHRSINTLVVHKHTQMTDPNLFVCVTLQPSSCRPASHTSFRFHTPASVGDTHRAPWQPHLSGSISTTVGETQVVFCSELDWSVPPPTPLLSPLHGRLFNPPKSPLRSTDSFGFIVRGVCVLCYISSSADNVFYL